MRSCSAAGPSGALGPFTFSPAKDLLRRPSLPPSQSRRRCLPSPEHDRSSPRCWGHHRETGECAAISPDKTTDGPVWQAQGVTKGDSVYLLSHVHNLDSDEGEKLLGVYSSQALAEDRIERARRLPG